MLVIVVYLGLLHHFFLPHVPVEREPVPVVVMLPVLVSLQFRPAELLSLRRLELRLSPETLPHQPGERRVLEHAREGVLGDRPAVRVAAGGLLSALA